MALAARGHDAEVVVTHASSANRKAGQLAAVVACQREQPDFVIVADSDVELGEADGEALLGPLDDARVGAVWAPPLEIAPSTLADRASAAVLDASLHAFRLVHSLDGTTLVGKLFAIRATDLERVGGFGGLDGYLGEDAELSRRLREQRLVVRIAGISARSLASGRSFASVVARYTRWLWVVRSQRPLLLASYPMLFLACPIALTLALTSFSMTGLALAATVSLLRLLAALLARHASKRAAGGLRLVTDVVLGDVVLLLAFAALFRGNTIRWRDHDLVVRAQRRSGGLRDARRPLARTRLTGVDQEPRRG